MTKDEMMMRIMKEGHSFPHGTTCKTCDDDFQEVFDAGVHSIQCPRCKVNCADEGTFVCISCADKVFSRVTPCCKEIVCKEPCNMHVVHEICNKTNLCLFCRGRAVGREESERDVPFALLKRFDAGLKQGKVEGRLDAAKKIMGMIDLRQAEIKAVCKTDVFDDLPSEVQVEISTLGLLWVDIKKEFWVGEQ